MFIIFLREIPKNENIKYELNINTKAFEQALYNVVKTQIKTSIRSLLHKVDIIDTISFANMLNDMIKTFSGYKYRDDVLIEVLQEMEDNKEIIYIETSNKNRYVYLPIYE